MTLDELRERLRYFTDHVDKGPAWWDDEAAHSNEDSIREAVLLAIADGTAEDPREMARLALTTSEFDFARWYA